jgi:hypothetical protein
MTTIVDLIRALAWPSVAVLGVWYFRNELKTALKRITEIGLSGAKFGPPPDQQIPSSPSIVTAQELPAPKPDVPALKPDVQTYIAQIKSFISADQLDPLLLKLKTELATVGTTSDQLELLLYLAASLTVQLSHERNYNGIFGSQLNLLSQANGAGGITPARANAFYEEAKAAYPQLYTTYRFDQWIGFLIAAGLLTQSAEGAYVLTNFGRGFLKYIIDRQLPVNKQF